MTKYFKYDPELKKRMLSKWLNSQKKFRISRAVSCTLYVLAAFVCFACFGIFEFTAVGLVTGAIFGIIPLTIGQVVFNKSRSECGRPYNRMTKEFLCVDDMEIQFGYHNTQNKYTASMDIYQIQFEDINKFKFDEEYNIVSIMGCGQLTVYDDYSLGRINRSLSERKFYSNSWYSFILAFEEQHEFLELLNRKKKWED